jgi:NADH-quinone oxidoreductase subunit A
MAEDRVGDGAAPARVLAARHERVHQVVAASDAAEHLGHVARLVGLRRQHGAHRRTIAPANDLDAERPSVYWRQVLGTFGPIALFLVVAVIFPIVPLVLSRFLAPDNPNPVKLEPYESGMETIGPTHVQFPIRYYLYALIFVIFDVEVIYLFPWALVYDKLPLIAPIEMAAFIALLLVGLAYAWRKRAFEWQ